jgi:hypothetical protein
VRGSKERLDQFDQGKIDVMLLTLDYVANLYADYKAKGTDLKAFHFVDWSRGNMGIVAKPAFTSIESLKTAASPRRAIRPPTTSRWCSWTVPT